MQVTDPNGVIVQLLDWNGPAGHPALKLIVGLGVLALVGHLLAH